MAHRPDISHPCVSGVIDKDSEHTLQKNSHMHTNVKMLFIEFQILRTIRLLCNGLLIMDHEQLACHHPIKIHHAHEFPDL